MCLILFAYGMDEKYKLIVAANRDEAYSRPTLPAHFWREHPNLLAGRDMEKGGTWMGVTKNGRFAALTNYWDKSSKLEGKRSRGELVAQFLSGSHSPEQHIAEAIRRRLEYPGYNLLVGNIHNLYYYSNAEHIRRKMEPGIYGLSNHLLNTEWPKVVRGRDGLSRILKKHAENADDEELSEALLTLLRENEPAPDALLSGTGMTTDMERAYSSLFIESAEYGTRSSAVVLMSDTQTFFKERIYENGRTEDRTFSF